MCVWPIRQNAALASVAQWIAHLITDQAVGSSSLSWGTSAAGGHTAELVELCGDDAGEHGDSGFLSIRRMDYSIRNLILYPENMAQKIIIERTSDLSDTPGAEEVLFGVNGKSYIIDLTADEAKAFQDFLAPYVSAGRTAPTKGKGPKTANVPSPSDEGHKQRIRTIRAWAEANGHLKKGSRGRISADVQEAYALAHGGSPTT